MRRSGIDWSLIGSGLVIVLVAALLCLGIYADYESERNCVNHGGHEVITGYSVISTGKSVSIVPQYTCEGEH